MKRNTFSIFLAALLLLSCNNSGDNKTGTDSTSKKEPVKNESMSAPPDSATMMKNWEAYMTPGDMHKMMATWDGTWNAEITMWEKPGAPPQKSTGTTTNKMIMGGRYQESVHNSTMMGMPFEGHGTVGYDNAKKVFVSTWIDNLGTGMMSMSGPWDAATKSVNFTGKSVDPMTGKENDYKETFKIIDDNTQMMSMNGHSPDGKEFTMMEIRFTRKK